MLLVCSMTLLFPHIYRKKEEKVILKVGEFK